MSVDHSGHRQRLKRAERENGLLSFSPHEVIELMLYPVLPRRDVNELAHRISDALGGVCGLTDADDSALDRIPELTRHTKDALDAYRRAVRVYEKYASNEGRFLHTRGDMDAFSASVFQADRRMLALLSSGREVICVSPLPGDAGAGYICEKILAYDASYAFIVCSKDMRPPDEKTEEIQRALAAVDACLLDTATI